MRQKNVFLYYFFSYKKQLFFEISLFLMVSTASPQAHNRCLPAIRRAFIGMDKC